MSLQYIPVSYGDSWSGNATVQVAYVSIDITAWASMGGPISALFFNLIKAAAAALTDDQLL